MTQKLWPRLAEAVAGLTPAQRAEAARALGLPAAEAGCRYLLDTLVNERLIRSQIKKVSARAVARIIQDGGRAGKGADRGYASLLRAGLLLPSGDGPVFPLEFAFAAEEMLPEESLLRVLARGKAADLNRWLGEIEALLGPAKEEGRRAWWPTPLPAPVAAAEIHTLLVSRADELLAGLDAEARSLLQEFGPLDGMAGRRAFMAAHETDAAAREAWLSPLAPYPGSSRAVRDLLARGLVASSGTPWQPGHYLHIPMELRQAALAPYRESREQKARDLLAAAAAAGYEPTGPLAGLDGEALLGMALGVLACLPLRLTRQGAPVQADLERAGRIMGLPPRQVEALVKLAAGLGLAAAGEASVSVALETWPVEPIHARRALPQALRLLSGGPPSPQQEFTAFLETALLEILQTCVCWLPCAVLAEILPARPGFGRWLEYVRDRHAPGEKLALALHDAVEELAWFGALSVETDGRGLQRAVRLTPWGRALLSPALTVGWPPPEPLTVTASHEIYAPLGAGPAALGRLAGFAELVTAGPAFLFRLSRETVWKAAADGVKIGAELAWLEEQARGGLPENVRATLAEVAARQGEVRLGEAGGYIAIGRPELAAAVRQVIRAAGAFVVAEESGLLILAPGADLGELAEALRHAGILADLSVTRRAAKKSAPHGLRHGGET
ncbi:MAG: helicase-associated domain-containing protein [Patescibacteria group bacterium]